MKHLIEKVLEEYADAEVNLKSSAARKMVASGITAVLKTRDDLGVDEYPYPSDFGDKEREVDKAKWVCEHCGKNTFDVDWDYIGTNYNQSGTLVNRPLNTFKSPYFPGNVGLMAPGGLSTNWGPDLRNQVTQNNANYYANQLFNSKNE